MRFEDIVFVYQLRDERQIAWHGRLHSHPEGRYELHYFINGSGSFRNGSAVYSIRPGALHLSAPLMSHQIIATDTRKPITYYALLLDVRNDDEARDLLDRLIWPRSGAEPGAPCGRRGARGPGPAADTAPAAGAPPPYPLGGSQRFFFADLREKAGSGRPELEKAASHGLLSLLYTLSAGAGAVLRTGGNAHVEKAIAIMQSSIEGELSLNEICSRIQLSEEHFVRLFSERMGMPPMRYYGRLKIEAAEAMLSSTNLRVQEIADKLGYENQFNFARAFKRATAMSPSAYRVLCLQRADFAARA